jgi:adenine-specific DNA-methyltransferase
MTRDQIQAVLRQTYDQQRWLNVLREIMPGTDIFGSPQPIEIDHQVARHVLQLGRVRLAGDRQLAVLEIEVSDRIDVVRNRVGLRNFVARFIDQERAHGVLAVFLSPEQDYRFTFAAKESAFGNDGTLATKETAPRRYTYVLGPNEPCRTAAERFLHLSEKGLIATLDDVIEAFSVEKLNKEFFADFCRAFDRVSKDIRNHHPKWSDVEVEREAQTLLDRLVFLYFVQRKGWLNRQRDYLSRHFHDAHEGKAGNTFIQQFLRPLFVKLSTEGQQADIPGHDLPFLNGGLFNDEYGDENTDDSSRRRADLLVANDTFAYLFENLLERYNFTIHEDSPTNQEVAIDPEMLGKIFEALVLQIEQSTTGGKSLRHDTGSHYTPRPIVQYLCVAALAGWLENQPPFACPSPAGAGEGGRRPGEGRRELSARERIAKLLSIDTSEGIDEQERATLNECVTPEEAAVLLDRLVTLRACDPAVGSGAFPMGLLRELLNLARLCETRARGQDPVEGERGWLYETKKRIIERVIYGVDLQERAIEICKLRLWLSLMVDHNLGVDPANCDQRSFRRALTDLEPLPNLDFKIRRADSLVDKIHGEPIPLGKINVGSQAQVALNELTTAKREFYAAERAVEKRRLRLAIYKATAELAQIELTAARNELGLIPDPTNAGKVAELDRGRRDIGRVLARVRDVEKLQKAKRISVAGIEQALADIRDFFDNPAKPTFVWHLDFAEVFFRQPTSHSPSGGVVPSRGSARGEGARELGLNSPAASQTRALDGFDIVLANPPYVRQELLGREYKENQLAPIYSEVYSGTADLYIYFYARAHQLLRAGGVGAFISSNKWLRAGYGEKLRQFLLDDQEFRLVVDFGELPVFEAAATFPAIFVWRKQARANSTTTWAVVRDLATCYFGGIANFVALAGQVLPASQFGKGKPRLASNRTVDRRSKMEASGERLGQLVAGRILNGVKTGLNKAFIINHETRAEIIAEAESAASFIKPFLVGDDVRRFEIHARQQFLIYLTWDDALPKVPRLRTLLKKHQDALRERDGVKDEGGCPWYALSRPRPEIRGEYESPKIIYPDIGKEARFVIDTVGYFVETTVYLIPGVDWYMLGVLNSSAAFDFFKNAAAVLGDADNGGRVRLKKPYIEALPIPNAPESERDAVAKLAQEAQRLHGQRRAVVEKFLRAVGLPPAQSTSRNPLEQPWTLAPEEVTRRAPRPDAKRFTPARDETAALTEQIQSVEREIDQRVATLYGL